QGVERAGEPGSPRDAAGAEDKSNPHDRTLRAPPDGDTIEHPAVAAGTWSRRPDLSAGGRHWTLVLWRGATISRTLLIRSPRTGEQMPATPPPRAGQEGGAGMRNRLGL